MGEDPLAQFRRQSPKSPDAPSPEASGYEAFKAVDKRQFRLQVRPASKAWERLPYGYLLRVVEDGTFGTELCLVYTFMVVVALGRNLQGIGDAIGDERCEFLQAFDPDRFEKPQDDKSPIIESITLHEKMSPSEALEESLQATKH